MADTGEELSELAVDARDLSASAGQRPRAASRPISSRCRRLPTRCARSRNALAGHGRLLVRYSGTEPLLRIMLEGKDEDEIAPGRTRSPSAVRTHLA